MEALIGWRRRLDRVGVEVTEHRRLHDRLHALLIAPGDEQHAPRGRVELPDPGQQLRSRTVRQPLVGKYQADRARVVAKSAEDRDRRAGRARDHDLVVGSVALAQLRLDAAARPRAVDQQHNRYQLRLPRSRTTTATLVIERGDLLRGQRGRGMRREGKVCPI